MQDIKEIEFRDNGSNANTKISFEVRTTALRPCLHTEGFSLYPHRTSHKENLRRGICSYKLRVYNSSLQHNHLYSRGKTLSQNKITSTQRGIGIKPNHNHLYTNRDRYKAKPQLQSPLHKRDEPNPKQRKDYNLSDHNRPQTILGDHIRPQTIFLTKQDPIDRIRCDS